MKNIFNISLKLKTVFSVVGVLISFNAFASSYTTHLCITNNTTDSHLITVGNIDNISWGNANRPTDNFNNITIQPNETICKQEDFGSSGFKDNANPHFSFYIDGEINKAEMVAIEYLGDKVAAWYTTPQSALSSTESGSDYDYFTKNGINYHRGDTCQDRGKNCWKFEINKSNLAPSGSYTSTCKDIEYDAELALLDANCEKAHDPRHNAEYNKTILDYLSCNSSTVINDNGSLKCN